VTGVACTDSHYFEQYIEDKTINGPCAAGCCFTYKFSNGIPDQTLCAFSGCIGNIEGNYTIYQNSSCPSGCYYKSFVTVMGIPVDL
jgi:hypothetical protein